jgi:hypothetical protein
LALAEDILAHPRLPPLVGRYLMQARPAFLLGSTAPDTCTLGGQPRPTTHFFKVPMKDSRPASQRLLAQHPQLARSKQLKPDHAAFLAGYLAHIAVDQAWVRCIFEPVYGLRASWLTFHQRLVDHNLLRAHLDQLYRGRLPGDLAIVLRDAEPNAWLPFTPDTTLRRWRDHIAEQLEPGARSYTVAVFAERLGIEAEGFAARLQSQKDLERSIFRHISNRRLEAFHRLSLRLMLEVVMAYFEGKIEDG